MIDPNAYPHIIASILRYADAGTLFAFQLVSRTLRDQVEQLFARRLSGPIRLINWFGDAEDEVHAVTEHMEYAGIRVPSSAPQRVDAKLPQAMVSRCALVTDDVLPSCSPPGLPALSLITEHLHPESYAFHWPMDDLPGDFPASDVVDLKAQNVRLLWRMPRAGKFPYTIKATWLSITYSLALPPPAGSPITWTPPSIICGTLILDFTGFSKDGGCYAPKNDLAPEDGIALLKSVASILAAGDTRVFLASPRPITDRIDRIHVTGPPRSVGAPGKVSPHLLWTLKRYITEEVKATAPSFSDQQVARLVRSSLARLFIAERDSR